MIRPDFHRSIIERLRRKCFPGDILQGFLQWRARVGRRLRPSRLLPQFKIPHGKANHRRQRKRQRHKDSRQHDQHLRVQTELFGFFRLHVDRVDAL